jgi:hypothetical protein
MRDYNVKVLRAIVVGAYFHPDHKYTASPHPFYKHDISMSRRHDKTRFLTTEASEIHGLTLCAKYIERPNGGHMAVDRNVPLQFLIQIDA